MNSAQQVNLSELKIMLVDDDELYTDFMQILLKFAVSEISVFNNSLDALDNFKQHSNHYDVVISDQKMPLMKGDEMVEECLKIRPNIPVIMCSSNVNDVNVERMKQMGVKQFLAKPVDYDTIVDAIDKVIQ